MLTNADKPAHPMKPEVIGGNHQVYFGLTKREDIAKYLMAQMVRQFGAGENSVEGYSEHARQALFATDALLDALAALEKS